jgi:hypothetical protein
MQKQKKSMLEYWKILLGKIRFYKKLFRKEYRKSFRYLKPDEQFQLKEWLRQRFGKEVTLNRMVAYKLYL